MPDVAGPSLRSLLLFQLPDLCPALQSEVYEWCSHRGSIVKMPESPHHHPFHASPRTSLAAAARPDLAALN